MILKQINLTTYIYPHPTSLTWLLLRTIGAIWESIEKNTICAHRWNCLCGRLLSSCREMVTSESEDLRPQSVQIFHCNKQNHEHAIQAWNWNKNLLTFFNWIIIVLALNLKHVERALTNLDEEQAATSCFTPQTLFSWFEKWNEEMISTYLFLL